MKCDTSNGRLLTGLLEENFKRTRGTMDLLTKNLLTTGYHYGTTSQRAHVINPKRSKTRTMISTVIVSAMVYLMVLKVAAAKSPQPSSFTWDTDDITELKILQCIFEIHRENMDVAVKIFNDINEYTNYYLIYMIIKRGYDNNSKNTLKLVNFTTKLPWCNHQYAGFAYIFDELKLDKKLRSSESIQFAYKLKKFIDGNQTCLHKNDDQNLLANIKKLKQHFPEAIKLIVWESSKLCLRSMKFDEHLYVAECCAYDEERRRVFTWIPKGDIGPHGEWSFEPTDDTASVFLIKSDRYQEYLYAAECCTYDKDRRNVFTWIPKTDIGPHGGWVLELVNGTNAFRIKNNYFGEYLYAAECCTHDEDRRSLFTWIAKGDVGDHGNWEITSC